VGRNVLAPRSTTAEQLTVIEVSTADAIDYDSLAKNLRAHDALEVQACLPDMTLPAALRYCVETSDAGCWVAVNASGEYIGVWGMATTESTTIGVPWLLMSDEILDNHRRTFIVHSSLFLKTMSERFRSLINQVHADNHKAIRWLTWLGFKVGEPLHFVNGEPFRVFQKHV
jgi:hypothetical protein